MAAFQIAARHFGRKAVADLARKGIRIVGLQAVPNMAAALPFAEAETCYQVDDNGCGRVWTYAQVRAAI
jgi:nitrous oxide reductase accessory protein NosL